MAAGGAYRNRPHRQVAVGGKLGLDGGRGSGVHGGVGHLAGEFLRPAAEDFAGAGQVGLHVFGSEIEGFQFGLKRNAGLVERLARRRGGVGGVLFKNLVRLRVFLDMVEIIPSTHRRDHRAHDEAIYKCAQAAHVASWLRLNFMDIKIISSVTVFAHKLIIHGERTEPKKSSRSNLFA